MSSKKKNTITVDFSNAEASEHVTGSMYHVKAGDLELLLDCGLAQSNNILKDYRANNAHFKFKAKNIKYIFLSHLHYYIKEDAKPLLLCRKAQKEFLKIWQKIHFIFFKKIAKF